jgi:hypothetical protein
LQGFGITARPKCLRFSCFLSLDWDGSALVVGGVFPDRNAALALGSLHTFAIAPDDNKQQSDIAPMPGAQEGKPITQGLRTGKARENYQRRHEGGAVGAWRAASPASCSMRRAVAGEVERGAQESVEIQSLDAATDASRKLRTLFRSTAEGRFSRGDRKRKWALTLLKIQDEVDDSRADAGEAHRDPGCVDCERDRLECVGRASPAETF